MTRRLVAVAVAVLAAVLADAFFFVVFVPGDVVPGLRAEDPAAVRFTVRRAVLGSLSLRPEVTRAA